MGEHDAPVSWLQRWQEAEPLRLYLWTVATAVLFGGVTTGLWTETWALAVGGVLAAALMIGGTALARRHAYAPRTVMDLLDEQHATSYGRGYAAALRTVQEAAARRPELEPATQLLEAQLTETRPAGKLRRCRLVEGGRRCVLPQHPENVDHRLEERRARE